MLTLLMYQRHGRDKYNGETVEMDCVRCQSTALISLQHQDNFGNAISSQKEHVNFLNRMASSEGYIPSRRTCGVKPNEDIKWIERPHHSCETRLISISSIHSVMATIVFKIFYLRSLRESLERLLSFKTHAAST